MEPMIKVLPLNKLCTSNNLQTFASLHKLRFLRNAAPEYGALQV